MKAFERVSLCALAAALIAGCSGMQSSQGDMKSSSTGMQSSSSGIQASSSMQSSTATTFTARLSGDQEVPAVMGSGTGTLKAQLDPASRKLTYEVTYSGLSGPATAAHFHGPAAAGQNAGVVVPVASAATPIRGEATLTEQQAADLRAGRMYFNVHTAAHPGGEIRGQVAAQ